MPPLRLPGEVLEFWFSEQARPLWFERNAAFDEEIRSRFGATVAAACLGDLSYWVRAVDSSLALVLLLDQFPRNIHRGTLRAFAGDARRARHRQYGDRPRLRPARAARPPLSSSTCRSSIARIPRTRPAPSRSSAAGPRSIAAPPASAPSSR